MTVEITNAMVDGAITFARTTWRSDGAEGETVHLLCNAIEQMRNRAHCTWCGIVTENNPRAMVDHMVACEKRTNAQETELRRLREILTTALHDLARAPCRWPAGVPEECSEGDPCLTHGLLGHSMTLPTGGGSPGEGNAS